jgi:hypothetical protein
MKSFTERAAAEDFLREAEQARRCHPKRDGRDKPGHDDE